MTTTLCLAGGLKRQLPSLLQPQLQQQQQQQQQQQPQRPRRSRRYLTTMAGMICLAANPQPSPQPFRLQPQH